MNQDRPLVWTLHHGQRFKLTSQDGMEIRLPYRKVEELLVAILQGGPDGVLRCDLEKHFWPTSSPDSRQTNLRQLITQLRKGIGSEHLLSDRTRCAISSRLTIRCLPALTPFAPVQKSKLTPVEAFYGFVDSMACSAPTRMMETMKQNLDLADAMSPFQKSAILKQFGNSFTPSDPNFMWFLFWSGSIALQTRGIRPAKHLFQEAAKRGMASGDGSLVGIASYSWALCEILLGEPAKAIKISNQTEAYSNGNKNLPALRQNIIKPVAMIHLGKTREGMSNLEKVECFGIKSENDFQVHEALVALFEATNGKYQAAVDRVEAPLRISTAKGDLGLKTICEFTKLFVFSRTQPHAAIGPLLELIADCKMAQLGHIELYAREALASCYRAVGETSLAEKSFLKAKDSRIALGFQLTDWDRTRLVAV